MEVGRVGRDEGESGRGWGIDDINSIIAVNFFIKLY